jgi:hypothetical protein
MPEDNGVTGDSQTQNNWTMTVIQLLCVIEQLKNDKTWAIEVHCGHRKRQITADGRDWYGHDEKEHLQFGCSFFDR